MNVADIVFLGIIGYAGYRGFQRGFLISFISIIAFVFATILAFALLHWGVQVLEESFDSLSSFGFALPYLAFAMIFIGVTILINFLGKFLKSTIDLTLLGSVDSIAGGMLGVLKWIFGLSLLIWLVQYLGFKTPDSWRQDSMLYAQIEPVAPYVMEIFSEYIPFLKSILESVRENFQPTAP